MDRPLRHIISINDLQNWEIEAIFDAAQKYLEQLPDAAAPYRIGRSTDLASPFILATLFYEPSTRTRLSFESAMLRLGGRVITSADPSTSSAAKGETLADTVRVIGNYADVIVIRHNRDGAARLAADYAPVPIINGGDGSHEHPTQTLCDIFTLKKRHKTLKNLNVAISGDLKGSRTIHSFVYALARFRSTILLMPAKGMALPAHVDARLREEFDCLPVPREKYEKKNSSIDALYVTPDKPHQLTFIPDVDVAVNVKILRKFGKLELKKIHAMYVTRFQKERWTERAQDYPTVDAHFLRGAKYAETSVLHPLPRVGELDAALDTDERAMYFQQAAYGVPIRMALLSSLLGVGDQFSLERFNSGFRDQEYVIYDRPLGTGIHCKNSNCIVEDEAEKHYCRNKFIIIPSRESLGCKLRCYYCETDISEFITADEKMHSYVVNPADARKLWRAPNKDLIFFASEADARDMEYHPRESSVPRRRRHSPAA
jgi:aspartate carbamoyltransferase catalytic subunit